MQHNYYALDIYLRYLADKVPTARNVWSTILEKLFGKLEQCFAETEDEFQEKCTDMLRYMKENSLGAENYFVRTIINLVEELVFFFLILTKAKGFRC